MQNEVVFLGLLRMAQQKHVCDEYRVNEFTLLTAITAELRGRAVCDLLPMPNWRAGLA